MSSSPLLEVEGLSVEYRRRRKAFVALNEVTFDLAPGETLGVVGESGSGKSTLARAILGLAPIRSGSIRLEGRDITHLRFKERREVYRQVQMVFQDPYSSLNPSRTIGRTLVEPLEAHGEHNAASARARVREMLGRVHMPPEAADRYPDEFSGGQRQRIAIARSLVLSPQLVICDEAVSALDLSVQAQVLNLLRQLQADGGLSYLFISHDLEVVRHLCHRVLVLYHGRVMECGSAAQVSGSPAHPYTYALHEAAPLPNPRAQRLKRERASKVDAEAVNGAGRDPEQGCPFARRCPHAIARCWTDRPAIRPTEEGGIVACHRYPEWRAESASPVVAMTGPRR